MHTMLLRGLLVFSTSDSVIDPLQSEDVKTVLLKSCFNMFELFRAAL